MANLATAPLTRLLGLDLLLPKLGPLLAQQHDPNNPWAVYPLTQERSWYSGHAAADTCMRCALYSGHIWFHEDTLHAFALYNHRYQQLRQQQRQRQRLRQQLEQRQQRGQRQRHRHRQRQQHAF